MLDLPSLKNMIIKMQGGNERKLILNGMERLCKGEPFTLDDSIFIEIRNSVITFRYTYTESGNSSTESLFIGNEEVHIDEEVNSFTIKDTSTRKSQHRRILGILQMINNICIDYMDSDSDISCKNLLAIYKDIRLTRFNFIQLDVNTYLTKSIEDLKNLYSKLSTMNTIEADISNLSRLCKFKLDVPQSKIYEPSLLMVDMLETLSKHTHTIELVGLHDLVQTDDVYSIKNNFRNQVKYHFNKMYERDKQFEILIKYLYIIGIDYLLEERSELSI